MAKVKGRRIPIANNIFYRLLMLCRMAMNQENTEILRVNGPQLIDHIDIEHTLLSRLLAKKVITRSQMDHIESFRRVCWIQVTGL